LAALRAARRLTAIASLSGFLAAGAPTAHARFVEIHRPAIELAHRSVTTLRAMRTGLT